MNSQKTQDNDRFLNDFRDAEYAESYAGDVPLAQVSIQVTKVREQRGMSQQELAEAAGLSLKAIQQAENIHQAGQVTVDKLIAISKALGMALSFHLVSFGELSRELAQGNVCEPIPPQAPDHRHDPVLFPADNVPEWLAERASSGQMPDDEFLRTFLKWQKDGENPETLRHWITGYGLPAVGDEYSVSDFLLWTLSRKETPNEVELDDPWVLNVLHRLHTLMKENQDTWYAQMHDEAPANVRSSRVGRFVTGFDRLERFVADQLAAAYVPTTRPTRPEPEPAAAPLSPER